MLTQRGGLGAGGVARLLEALIVVQPPLRLGRLLLGVAFIDAALLDVLRNIDFKPLDRFQAEHLEYMVLLLCYWRELEDGGHGGDGPNKKPLVKGPDPLQ